VLTFIFVLYYANIFFFYHSHNINGLIISHSHFHTAAHTQTGSHTVGEISLISVLSAFQTLQAALLFFGIGLFLLTAIIFLLVDERKKNSAISGNPSLRAPPVLI
jgi:hypothetical protein